ncbi:hypothetical protein B4U84_29095 [Westiellopsis prolifica IICB1]|nr:hypothetical protein B4U84_29795 [Westiellopsis prolifica IICB1]TBR56603.1 hypothetical protein B4U84_29095 [Westiellopsis prolifica IICB1]
MVNSTDTQATQTSNQGGILKLLARLATTGIISFGIGGAVTFDRYNNYWNQTIFRVQTVDFNILSHTLPTKLSYAIVKNQPEEVQRTLDSNYNLFGLIVTDYSGQKIIAYSGKNSGRFLSWKAALNPQQLQNHPYDVLLDPPPVFPQWTYSQPQATERSATSLTNRGRVIGRVYYVRGVRPTFQEDIATLLSNPFSGSSRIQTYTTSLAACLGGTFLVWSILEFILYKKRVGEEKAQQELELAQARQEKAQRERELAEEREEKAQRESELAKEREQELINNNQILQLQLVDRIKELQSLQQQRDDERHRFEEEANNLRSLNNRLKHEIIQLRESIKNLSTNTNSVKLQEELQQAKTQSQQNLKQRQEYEQRIEKLTHQLQIIHKKQLKVSEQNEQKENELQELQQQINEIENARFFVESQLKELQIREEYYQKNLNQLEQQLNEQNLKEQALQNQLENLQNSLSQYQKREDILKERAEQSKAEYDALSEQIKIAQEDMGQHPLNDFELAIKESLEQNFSNSRIEIQFDVGSGRQGSKFTDFIVVTNNSCIILEAKSYKGVIKPINDARNTGWICQQADRKLHIFSCWGKNPYHQLKIYCDSLMKNRGLGIHNRSPIYGVVVFPKGSYIDESIKSNMGKFYRVTTLDNLITAIQELDNQANSRN